VSLVVMGWNDDTPRECICFPTSGPLSRGRTSGPGTRLAAVAMTTKTMSAVGPAELRAEGEWIYCTRFGVTFRI
jgi:hypothetical protein